MALLHVGFPPLGRGMCPRVVTRGGCVVVVQVVFGLWACQA